MERDNRQTWKRRLGSMARKLDASAHVGDGAAAAIDEAPERRRPPRRKGACSGTSSVVISTGPASSNLVTLYYEYTVAERGRPFRQ